MSRHIYVSFSGIGALWLRVMRGYGDIYCRYKLHILPLREVTVTYIAARESKIQAKKIPTHTDAEAGAQQEARHNIFYLQIYFTGPKLLIYLLPTDRY